MPGDLSPVALLMALPVSLAGIYFLLVPTTARMAEMEEARAHAVRRRLRRINGGVMIVLGVCLYAAVSWTQAVTAELARPGLATPLAWMATMGLGGVMLLLMWLDLRLTAKMRRDLRRQSAAAAAAELRAQLGRGKACVAAAGLALALLGGAGCDRDAAADDPAAREADPARQPQNLRRVEMRLGEEVFSLQVADDEEKRQKGLMFRTRLEPNEGMIFVFPEPEPLGFWMKNTYVPLDIIYVSEEGRVLNVAPMHPRDLRTVPSRGPAKWAIEIPQGAAERVGVRAGMVLDIPEGARESAEQREERGAGR